MARSTSIWERLRESTEGPTVTVQIPREWAEELLRSLATALEVEDMGDEPDMMGMPHMEPDEDDMGGPPDLDMDDLLSPDEEEDVSSDGDGQEDNEPPDDESDEDSEEDEEDDDEEEEEEQDESAGPYRPQTAVGEKYLGFDKLKNKLSREGKVRNPGGLAAYVGRKKYGKNKFQKAAAKGKKLG